MLDSLLDIVSKSDALYGKMNFTFQLLLTSLSIPTGNICGIISKVRANYVLVEVIFHKNDMYSRDPPSDHFN